MIEKNIERDILARMRTLLALERNYLAEERTHLAEFRTGLSISLIVVPISLFFITLEINILLYLIFCVFMGTISVWGIWMVFSSNSKLIKIKKRIKVVKYREKQIFNSSEVVRELFDDCIVFEDDH